MKIAIMGAGLAGLCCAITLEKNGVYPEIFEKRTMAGDRFINGEAMFNILNRPINHCLTYIKEKYDIHLEPISPVHKIIFHSKNEEGSIESNLGITNMRGRHENSFENQLYKQIKSKVHFNSKYTYEELKEKYEYVILATGDGAYAEKLNNYRCDLTCTIKGATVEGNFKVDQTQVWFNTEFAPKGYAYMIPFSEKEANIVIAYPDTIENKRKDINEMWERFYEQVSKNTKQNLKIKDQFEITKYMMGRCLKSKLDNTYYIGNNFGAISPGLGFGQFISILTGVYSAYDLCKIGDYEELTKSLFHNYENSLVIRRTLEKLNDTAFDFIVKNLDNKLFDKLINKIHGDESNFEMVKWISYVLRPLVYISQQQKDERKL